jgi:hypothetical protein
MHRACRTRCESPAAAASLPRQCCIRRHRARHRPVAIERQPRLQDLWRQVYQEQLIRGLSSVGGDAW